MVYDLDESVNITEKILYEPKIGKVKIRPLCYLAALLFIAEDAGQLYLTNINYFGRSDPYYSHVEWPLNLALRVVSIFTAIVLIYGIQMQRSTPIAVFLWTQFEVNMIYIPFYCYKAIEGMLKYGENYQMWGIFVIKCALWWMINSQHNYVKEKECVERGIVKRSTACTKVIRYRLPGQKTSI
ncbi:uncharacterized protein LOC134835650 [Culicoides brevitarsis]|uniref:uncharacterized protein LOC134835650 n=1 Tax=Culicoides brevitarsis TaxID=469753 RepID=UPI00307C6A0A